MGKGDKRSKRGKIILGSHGKSRPKKVAATAPKPAVEAPVEA
jgi:ribosomal small subunit protein bTHX